MPDNKNIGKLFSTYKLLFLDQNNSSSNPSQTLILQFPIPRASLTISVKFYPSQLKPFFNTIFTMFLIGFLIFNTKYTEFSIKSYVVLHFDNPTCAYKNSFLYFSQFSPSYSTLTFSQNHLYNTH